MNLTSHVSSVNEQRMEINSTPESQEFFDHDHQMYRPSFVYGTCYMAEIRNI